MLVAFASVPLGYRDGAEEQVGADLGAELLALRSVVVTRFSREEAPTKTASRLAVSWDPIQSRSSSSVYFAVAR